MSTIYFFKPNQKYGMFSQWYYSLFSEDGKTFSCAEQYMMYYKALVFNDLMSCEKILNTPDPRLVKQLGRQIKNFNEHTWKRHRSTIVENGNYLKFTQNLELLEELRKIPIGTNFIEASPYDRIWGIGYSKEHAENHVDDWGLNLLGKALEKVHMRIA